MQKPSLCRMVIVPVAALSETDRRMTNGAGEVAAVITRVWSNTMVNVMAFMDGGTVIPKTSLTLHESREAYAAGDSAYGCYWPPRV